MTDDEFIETLKSWATRLPSTPEHAPQMYAQAAAIAMLAREIRRATDRDLVLNLVPVLDLVR